MKFTHGQAKSGKLFLRGSLGIAVELVSNPTPAERLHPGGARDDPAAYLEAK